MIRAAYRLSSHLHDAFWIAVSIACIYRVAQILAAAARVEIPQ